MLQNTTLGERIAEARDARGLSVAQTAQRTAVGSNTLRNWESGATSPRPNKLQMLAGVLGVPLSWLLNGSDEHDPLSDSPSRLDQLEQKIERMNLLQRELFQLSNEVTEEIAAIRKIDEELEELVA